MKKIILFIFVVIANSVLSQSIPLQNLKLWLRADTGITKDVSNNISVWKDVSGNNNDLFAYAGEEPQFISALGEINNFPTISISNVKGFTFNTTFLIDSFSVFYIAKKNSVSDILAILGDSITYTGIYSWNDGNYYLQEAVSFVAVPNNNTADYSAYCFSYDKSKVKVYKDGVLTGQSNFIYSGDFAFNQLGRSEFYGAFPSSGEIAEIIIYNSVLNQVDRDIILNYLSNKYASSVNLGQDIIISSSFCDTVISTVGYYENYLWSTGAATPTISVNQSGKYWVQATDIFGRTTSDTILVTYPTISLPSQNAFCSNDTIVWNTGLSKSLFTFLWQDNSTDSIQKIHTAGSYSVQITDTLGCFVSSGPISITEDTFSSTTSLGPDTNLCAGNSVALVTPTTAVSSYSWSTGATTSAITVTNTGQYSVVVTNTNNCVAKDTIQVNIIGQAPTADFNNTVSCKNQVVNFNDNSSPPSGNTITSWYWNYGDNSTLADTSHLQNTFYTYADTGLYSVSLIVETNVGCKQQFIKTIHVAPVPTASFAIPAVACQNDSVLFQNQSSNLPGYSMSAYNWNFGDLGTSNAVSPKHLYSNNQNYTVKLLATNNAGCKDSIYKVVSVKAEVKADFTTLKACTNSPTLFQSASIAPSGATYLWDFGNSSSNVPNPTKLYTNSGVYSVKLDVDGGNGCTSSITKLINVYLPPLVSFSASAFCAKDTIQITNTTIAQSGVVASSNWRLNGTSFSTGQTPTLSIASPATYTVLLTTVNSFGCTDSASQALTVYDLPNVDFITNPASYYYLDTPVTFSATINNANSYYWNISSIMTSTVSSPVTTFTLPGTYTVMLNLIDENGCEGNKTKLMNVAKRYLDLAVMSVKTSKDNAGFISVIADLANYGSVPVTTFDIHYQTNDAGNNKETWNGSINPNSFYTYTFTAKSASKLSDQNNITCVHIESVNTIQDENLLNNDLCNSLNYDNISVENPLPNPTDGDITLPIILTKDMEFTMAIYNAMGQIQMPETTYNGLQGLNFITLPTSSLARGSYIIKVMINDKVFIKKFIRINN